MKGDGNDGGSSQIEMVKKSYMPFIGSGLIIASRRSRYAVLEQERGAMTHCRSWKRQ
jgi:hypothetical protein